MIREKIPYWKNLSQLDLTDIVDGIFCVEEWKDVEGHEGLYKVSSFGRVKSIQRVVPHKTSKSKTIPERVLKISKDSQGYLLANLWKENKCFHGLVHRLVAKAFINNIDNLPEVNHKWGDKEDNRVSELNWTTSRDNQKHSYDVLNRSRAVPSGADNHKSKKVKCTTLDIEFDSFVSAAEKLGVSQSAISMICAGTRNHTHGLVFKYI